MEVMTPARSDSFKAGAWGYARLEIPRKEVDKLDFSGVSLVGERVDSRKHFVMHEELRHKHLFLPVEKPIDDSLIVVVKRHNAFINLGLHFVLDRLFNLNTPNTSITHMGLSDDSTAVTAATLLLDPTASGDSPKIRALASGTGATATSRTTETVTCSAGWAKTDFTTVFIFRKIALLNTSTDAGDDTVPTVQGAMNIIGGSGGSSPYNEPFTIDLTGVSAFNATFLMDITAQAT